MAYNGGAICEVICILQIACWWTGPKGWTLQIAPPLSGKPAGLSTQRLRLKAGGHFGALHCQPAIKFISCSAL